MQTALRTTSSHLPRRLSPRSGHVSVKTSSTTKAGSIGARSARSSSTMPMHAAPSRRFVHPAVYEAIDRWFASLSANTSCAVADIPLLYETEHESAFDVVVVAACPPEEQLRRVMARDGLSNDEASARISSQWPIDEKVRSRRLRDSGRPAARKRPSGRSMRCSRRSANVGPSFSLGHPDQPSHSDARAEARVYGIEIPERPLAGRPSVEELCAGLARTSTSPTRPGGRDAHADLMRVFYFTCSAAHRETRRFAGPNVDSSEAARRSSIRYYRAAFVMSGDALRPLPRAVTWQTVIVSAAGAALLFGIAAAFMRSVARRLSPARSALR
jgi:hypothetical protein